MIGTRQVRYLLLLYVLAAIALAFSAASSQIDYQDQWILEGVTIPVIAYVLVFSLLVVKIKDNRLVSVISSSFLVMLNAIPNLKYQLFTGTFDSAAHYGFINRLLNTGHVPTTGFYSDVYSQFPGMHIFVGTLSLVSGISTNTSIKVITSIIPGLFPLFVYFATNNILDTYFQRWTLIASSIPVVTQYYVLSGNTFGFIFYFAFFCVLFRKLFTQINHFAYSTLLLILGYGLLFSHVVTMFFLLFGVTMLVLLRQYHRLRKKDSENHGDFILAILVILATSFSVLQTFKAPFIFDTLIGIIARIFLGEPTVSTIPLRFFELPLWAELNFLIVLHIKDAIVTLLSVIGLLVIFKKVRAKPKGLLNWFYLPLTLILLAVSSVLVFQLATGFGDIEYDRAINYALMFSPFFVGPALWNLNRVLRKNTIRLMVTALVIFLSISISLVQVFSYQPMVPTANVLSRNLPSSEYVLDLRLVNSVPKVELISFADRFAPRDVSITSDIVTRWQIYGFATRSFNQSYSIVQPDRPLVWNMALICYEGDAGPIIEQAEYRTPQRIQMLKQTLGSVIYNNGGCFAIALPP